MSLGNRRVVRIVRPFRSKRGLHHHLLVHLHLRTKVSIMARIHRTSELDQHNLKVVWHKEVVGPLYVVDVVETTQVSVVMARHVVSSVGKRDTS